MGWVMDHGIGALRSHRVFGFGELCVLAVLLLAMEFWSLVMGWIFLYGGDMEGICWGVGQRIFFF